MTHDINNTRAIRIAPILLRHHRRPRRHVLTALAVVTASAAVLAACGSSGPTSEPSSVTVTTAVETTSAAATTPSTTAAPTGPFRSALYGYVVTSLDWTGRSATTAWDGTGSPGNGDPTVDILDGPDTQQAYAFGGPTTMTLDEFVASSRAANAVAHSCPETPDNTASMTVGGEPAILDEVDCGVFALSATVVRAGRVYAFFTFDQPGKEAEMRSWFGSLLQSVTFDV